MVKSLLKFISFSFLLFISVLLLNTFIKSAEAAYTQIQCSGPYDTSCPPSTDGAVKCKPGWLNGQSTYTCQLDSGPGSCPGGFLCGTGGACTPNCSGAKCLGPGWGDTSACVYECNAVSDPNTKCTPCYYGSQQCTFDSYIPAGRDCTPITKSQSCVAPTATNTPTPTPNQCLGEIGRALNCSCTTSGECASGYCGTTQTGQKCLAAPPTPTNTPTPTPYGYCSPTPIVVGVQECAGYTPGTVYKTVKYTCPDGYTNTLTGNTCAYLSTFKTYVNSYCQNHMTCPTPTPTPTSPPTPTPTISPNDPFYCVLFPNLCPTSTPTPTPTSIPICDPNRDGKLDMADYFWWKDEYTGVKTTKNSDCYKPDGKIDILDFQVWKNSFYFKGVDAPQGS